MDTVEEKRVFADKTGSDTVLVAADIGIVSVAVTADRVGEFELVHRCSPRDIVGRNGQLVVATEEDVLVTDTFDYSGFGPAIAVGVDDGAPVAVGPDGGIGRFDGAWTDRGQVAGVAAIDGDLVAADDGVYRLNAEPVNVGLDAVRDVSAPAVPLAATATGLFALGNGWIDVLDGNFHVVTQRSDGRLGHASAADGFYERADNEWRRLEVPVDDPIIGVAYGGGVYAVTENGVFLAEAGDGWRRTRLGVTGVVGIALP